MTTNIADIRSDYRGVPLSKKKVDQDPVVQFEKWLNEAIHSKALEPTAMIIGTVGKNMRPATRAVLLKGVTDGKLVFYTNYLSRKGKQLEENANISATLFWKELERQIHVEGKVEKVPPEMSDDYFKSRPRNSRIGARISPQSQVIKSRTKIKVWFAKEAFRIGINEVPRPDFWGGYFIIPERFEFWQGRPNRLHDRVLYTKNADNTWKIDRLAP